MGLAQGDIANKLSAMVGDPNASIHEVKAFTCNLRPGRKAAAMSEAGVSPREDDILRGVDGRMPSRTTRLTTHRRTR